MGEYIGRMYMETKGRPIYIEKESNIEESSKKGQNIYELNTSEDK